MGQSGLEQWHYLLPDFHVELTEQLGLFITKIQPEFTPWRAGRRQVPLGLLMLGKHALDKIKLQFLSLDRVREINPACYSVNFPLSGTSVLLNH